MNFLARFILINRVAVDQDSFNSICQSGKCKIYLEIVTFGALQKLYQLRVICGNYYRGLLPSVDNIHLEKAQQSFFEWPVSRGTYLLHNTYSTVKLSCVKLKLPKIKKNVHLVAFCLEVRSPILHFAKVKLLYGTIPS